MARLNKLQASMCDCFLMICLLWILLCGLHCKGCVLWLVVSLGMFHVKRGGLFGVVVVVLWVGIVLP